MGSQVPEALHDTGQASVHPLPREWDVPPMETARITGHEVDTLFTGSMWVKTVDEPELARPLTKKTGEIAHALTKTTSMGLSLLVLPLAEKLKPSL